MPKNTINIILALSETGQKLFKKNPASYHLLHANQLA